MRLRVLAAAALALCGAARCTLYGEDGAQPPSVNAPDDAASTDGTLPDAASDASACAHDCGKGRCVDARCTPYVLVENVLAPFEITVDATYVYWTSLDYADAGGSGVIGKVEKKLGGDPREVVALENSFSISDDGDRLVVTGRKSATSGQAVHHIAKDGGAGSEIGLGTGPLQALARANAVWWTSAQGALFAAPTDGGASKKIAVAPDGGSIFEGIAADDAYVYFTHHIGTGGSVGRARIVDGVADVQWSADEHNPRRLALDDDAVYWMSDSVPGTIRRRAKASGTLAVTLLGDAGVGWGTLAVDGEHLYATLPGEKRVVRMDKRTGANVVDIATNLEEPNGIAVDEDAVYFVERAKNRIWRVVK